MMPKALHELLAQADELAARFEAYEPQPGDQDTVDPLTVLHLAALRRAEAERELAEAVERAREHKVSWRAIGDAVGTTGESARQRFGLRGVNTRNSRTGGGRTIANRTSAGRTSSKRASTGRTNAKRASGSTNVISGKSSARSVLAQEVTDEIVLVVGDADGDTPAIVFEGTAVELRVNCGDESGDED